MGKVLLWVIVIIGMLLITRILARYNHNAQRTPPLKKSRQQSVPQADPEPMVRCAHCSIHVPRSEAVLSKGQTWCCTEHAKLGPGA